MFSGNLTLLRKRAELSQEALAEKIGVSRQTVAKWESGESAPDVLHADRLAVLFDVSLDDLLHGKFDADGVIPRGKFAFGTVTVGDKGQIVIPVKARRIFNIQPGDDLIMLGDIEQGLALLKADFFLEVARHMKKQEEKP